jgi:hypothetical protein
MQLPFLKQVLPGCTVVPVIVGATDAAVERALGEALAGYVADPETVIVVSVSSRAVGAQAATGGQPTTASLAPQQSDFCHWGKRFGYTPSTAGIPIHEHIRQVCVCVCVCVRGCVCVCVFVVSLSLFSLFVFYVCVCVFVHQDGPCSMCFLSTNMARMRERFYQRQRVSALLHLP